jgi:hypothetical protein
VFLKARYHKLLTSATPGPQNGIHVAAAHLGVGIIQQRNLLGTGLCADHVLEGELQQESHKLVLTT